MREVNETSIDQRFMFRQMFLMLAKKYKCLCVFIMQTGRGMSERSKGNDDVLSEVQETSDSHGVAL
jgi:hypothetical protein